jgi:aspartate carbamoyltransferase catalytic subunit
MTTPPRPTNYSFPHRHLLGIEGLSSADISHILDLSEGYVTQNRQANKTRSTLHGRTLINLFFETSTRTRTSFELAGKRLGADVINMTVATSSIKKGETMIDTAVTLNAMHPDVLAVRHPDSGAVSLLSEKVNGAVINAGDGSHEHPTQALLDALTIRRRRGRLDGLLVAICGDVLHSRVARSNIHLLNTMGARVRVIAPRTLLPTAIERMGVEVCRGLSQHVRGAGRLRHRDDAAGPDRAHAGQLHPLGARVFPLLRPRLRQAGCGQGRRPDHASRANEPRCRDR